MTFLIVFLALIALIVIILSIPISLVVSYDSTLIVYAKWLFFKFDIHPSVTKKKDKLDKDKKGKDTKTKDDTTKKQGKSNPFIVFIRKNGVNGVLNLLQKTTISVKKALYNILRRIVFKEIYLTMIITGKDAADTALQYGKACEKLFPSFGALVSFLKVRKYNIDVCPDFLVLNNSYFFFLSASIKPIYVTNAVFVLAIELLFKVIIKFILSSRQKADKNIKIKQGGAN